LVEHADIAATKSRIPSAATSVAKGSEVDDSDFTCFLCTLLDGPTQQWKPAVTAGDALIHHQAVVKAVDHLNDLSWGCTQGGFQVPDGV
jgi:hypothetical protein